MANGPQEPPRLGVVVPATQASAPARAERFRPRGELPRRAGGFLLTTSAVVMTAVAASKHLHAIPEAFSWAGAHLQALFGGSGADASAPDIGAAVSDAGDFLYDNAEVGAVVTGAGVAARAGLRRLTRRGTGYQPGQASAELARGARAGKRNGR